MNENIPNDLLEKLRIIGVTNIENPTPEDITKILNATLKSKEIDADVFKNYMNYMSPQIKVLFDGLQTFAQSQEKISKNVLDMINNAINILGRELERDLSKDERKAIREEISSYIEKARIESDKQRKFYEKLAYVGGGTIIVVVGAALYTITKGKKPDLLEKGMQMVGKAIS